MKTIHTSTTVLLLIITLILGCQLMNIRSKTQEQESKIKVLARNYHFLNEEIFKITHPELVRVFNRPAWERKRPAPKPWSSAPAVEK